MEEDSVPSLLLLVLPAPTTLCEPPTTIAVLILDSPGLCEKLQGVSAAQPLMQCLTLSRHLLKPMGLMDEFTICHSALKECCTCLCSLSLALTYVLPSWLPKKLVDLSSLPFFFSPHSFIEI